MDFDLLLTLALVAFGAGFVDSIAGGGGLITLPALFLAGVDPISAIATNKFQASFSTVSATHIYHKKGLIDWTVGKKIFPLAMLGGIIGASVVALVDKRWLDLVTPILLLAVALYFALSSHLSKPSHQPTAKLPMWLVLLGVVPLIGFYDGIFGPGTGSFYMIAFIFLSGFTLMNALSLSKLANAGCNLGALAVFLWHGAIIWPIAFSMAVGSLLGAQLGARCAVFVGPRLIRPMIVLVCLGLAIKLLSLPTSPYAHLFSF